MNLAWPIMAALAVANLANGFGNWVLVSGRLGFPAMGVAGSGWATVGARAAMLGCVALYAVWHRSVLRGSRGPDHRLRSRVAYMLWIAASKA